MSSSNSMSRVASAPGTPAAPPAPPPAAEVEVVEGRDDPLRAARESSFASSDEHADGQREPYAPAAAHVMAALPSALTPVKAPMPAPNPLHATDVW